MYKYSNLLILVIVKIDNNVEISYALLANPTFTANYVETQHKVLACNCNIPPSSLICFNSKGEFLSIAKPVEAPISPVQLPAITASDKMMYLWLTDYIANTAGIVYQNAGILQYTLTPDVVGK